MTARDRILDLLSDLEWHKYLDLHAVGGIRYSARLLELKRLGYEINTKEISGLHHYRLVSTTPGEPQSKKVKIFLEEQDARQLLSGTVTVKAHLAVDDSLKSFLNNKDKL